MNVLDSVPWERLTWDTNRLRRGTQRAFHATAQERAGAATVVTERAARELAGVIDPRNMEESLGNAYRAYASPGRVAATLAPYGVRDVRAYLRMNIWWAEEWRRPDSPYEVRLLDEAEREHANALLAKLAESGVSRSWFVFLSKKTGFPSVVRSRCRLESVSTERSNRFARSLKGSTVSHQRAGASWIRPLALRQHALHPVSARRLQERRLDAKLPQIPR